jgi:hypothetical protein
MAVPSMDVSDRMTITADCLSAQLATTAGQTDENTCYVRTHLMPDWSLPPRIRAGVTDT